jgi:hypothetical protein
MPLNLQLIEDAERSAVDYFVQYFGCSGQVQGFFVQYIIYVDYFDVFSCCKLHEVELIYVDF